MLRTETLPIYIHGILTCSESYLRRAKQAGWRGRLQELFRLTAQLMSRRNCRGCTAYPCGQI